MADEIQGLPAGAIVKPMSSQSIEGLPPGAIVKPIQGQTPQQTQQPAPSFEDTLHAQDDARTGLVIGAAKKAGEGLLGLDNMIRSGLNKVGAHYEPLTPEDFGVKSDTLETKNPAQKTGGMVEQIAEFMLGDTAAAKGISAAAKLNVIQKVVKMAEETPYLAKLLHAGVTALRQGSVGTAQGIVHGEDTGTALEQGGIIGATGGTLDAAASFAPDAVAGVKSVASKVKNAVSEQPVLKDAVRSTAADAVKDATGIRVNPDTVKGSIRDTYSGASDFVMDKSKALFKQIDEATNGSFQPNQNALRQVQMDMRAAETDEALDNLKTKRTALESEQEEIFNEARKAGVDEGTVGKARVTYKQAAALEDVNNQLRMSTEGRQFSAAGEPLQSKETVDPKKLNGRLNKLYDSGRLQEAVGEQNAQKLLKAAESAQTKVTVKSWAKRIALYAGVPALGIEVGSKVLP